jgi:hypothetical protein
MQRACFSSENIAEPGHPPSAFGQRLRIRRTISTMSSLTALGKEIAWLQPSLEIPISRICLVIHWSTCHCTFLAREVIIIIMIDGFASSKAFHVILFVCVKCAPSDYQAMISI